MSKLLVITPDNTQNIIFVEEGGGYYDKSRVLWDERIDGPLPANIKPNLGGWIKDTNGVLKVDSTKLTAAQENKSGKVAADISAAQNRADKLTRLNSAIETVDTMTSAQLRSIVKDLLEHILNK